MQASCTPSLGCEPGVRNPWTHPKMVFHYSGQGIEALAKQGCAYHVALVLVLHVAHCPPVRMQPPQRQSWRQVVSDDKVAQAGAWLPIHKEV